MEETETPSGGEGGKKERDYTRKVYQNLMEDEKAMREMMDDMRRGAYVKAGLRTYGIPVEKELLM